MNFKDDYGLILVQYKFAYILEKKVER